MSTQETHSLTNISITLLCSYEQMFEEQIQLEEKHKIKEEKARAQAAVKGTDAGTELSPAEKNLQAFNAAAERKKKRSNRHSITVCSGASSIAGGNSLTIQHRAAQQQQQQAVFTYSQPRPKTAGQIAKETTVLQGTSPRRLKSK
jgi:hypothetical protein